MEQSDEKIAEFKLNPKQQRKHQIEAFARDVKTPLLGRVGTSGSAERASHGPIASQVVVELWADEAIALGLMRIVPPDGEEGHQRRLFRV